MRAIYSVTVVAIAVLLVTVSLRGYVAKPSTAKPAPVSLPRVEEPGGLPLVKSDRLSVPKPPPPPPKPVPPPPPVAELIELPAVTVREEVVSHTPILHSGSDKAQPRPSEGGARDPVCGARGRVWYTRDNGWRYWKCVR
jgi:hypothetical protein